MMKITTARHARTFYEPCALDEHVHVRRSDANGTEPLVVADMATWVRASSNACDALTCTRQQQRRKERPVWSLLWQRVKLQRRAANETPFCPAFLISHENVYLCWIWGGACNGVLESIRALQKEANRRMIHLRDYSSKKREDVICNEMCSSIL
jgi:hypothetical protein